MPVYPGALCLLGWLRRPLRPVLALRQVMLVEALPDQRLNNRLAAHIEVASGPIQFLQHAGGDIYVDPLNRLNHAALALEKTGNVFTPIGQPCNGLGGNRLGGFTSFLHIVESPPWLISIG